MGGEVEGLEFKYLGAMGWLQFLKVLENDGVFRAYSSYI
jgi:hypothetical protein